MKHILQRRRTDCGVASLAMILGISYNKALNALFPNKKKNTTYDVNLVRFIVALKKLNVKFDIKDVRIKALDKCNIANFKYPSIVAISQFGLGHAVIWTGSEILDPLSKTSYDLDYYQSRLLWILPLKDLK
jgi:ABC-type bacteriocin/lantibiotic exporter with double-glycine peptidase domain